MDLESSSAATLRRVERRNSLGVVPVSDLMREKKSVRLTFTAAAMSSTERFELEMLSMTYWFTCAMKRLPEGLAASPSMTR